MILNIFKFKSKDELNDLTGKEKNILIASILVESARSDGKISGIEMKKIKNILREKLFLDDDKVKVVLNQSIENSKNSVEVYSLTKAIRDQFEREEILGIFQQMWEIILVDGVIDDFEAALMSKITGLFHLTGREAAHAKELAKESIKCVE